MSNEKIKEIVELKIKFDETCVNGHTLFIKEHSVKLLNKEESNNKSTILVLNIPPYCNKECLQRLFGGLGKIKEIHEQKNPGKIVKPKSESKFFNPPPSLGFHVAYITFHARKSIARMKKFVKEQKEPICLSTSEKEIPIGMKKMCLDYISMFPDFSEVEEEVQRYMQDYDSKVDQEKEEEKRHVNEVDDDGWVKVTKKGKQPSFTRSEVNEIKMKMKLKRKQEKEKSLNIYSHQIREAKRERITELRKKFEEDKKKVEALKQSRKFRPY